MEQVFFLDGERITIKLAGRLGRQDALRLNSRLQEYRDKGYRSFTIDVRDLDISSAAEVSMLLGLRKKTVRCSGRLAIQEITGEIGVPNFDRRPKQGCVQSGRAEHRVLYFSQAREISANKGKC